MSKLIKDSKKPTKKAQVSIAPAAVPLSKDTVVSHLDACQKIVSDHALVAFAKFTETFDHAIGEQINSALTNQDAVDLAAVQRLLRESSSHLQEYYLDYLREGFAKFQQRKLFTAIGRDDDKVHAPEQLALVGDEDLEETIAISSLTQRADAYFAEPLWALNQRFAMLSDGEHVTEASNPAAPIQFCESFRKALKLLSPSSEVKSQAYKAYDSLLLPLVRDVTQDINEYLKSQGVLPHLRYTAPSGSAPAPYLSDTEVDEAFMNNSEGELEVQGQPLQEEDDYQYQLLHSIRELQEQLLVSSALTSGAVTHQAATTGYDNMLSISEAQLIEALHAVQQQPNHNFSYSEAGEVVTPLDIHQVIGDLKAILDLDAGDDDVPKNDMQTIDLVGMLFQYMLNDENLPDRIKALLSYLHTPFLKVAFIDPGFFEKTDHPARLLLNSLAEAGSRWVGNDGTHQYDMYEKIKSVVDRVLSEFDSDVKTITKLLLEFNGFTKNIIRRQELMEKRATEKAQGEEKLREVKLRVNDEIRKRTHNRELPSALLLFLLQPWSDYLSFSLLRFGDQSEQWTRALVLVDDVLWCIRPKMSEEDKQRQHDMHDGVVASIKAGFDTIGFDQTKGKKLIDALTSLMKLAMQSKTAEPAPAPMRKKLEKIAAEKAGSDYSDKSSASPEEAEMVERLKVIEFGTWFEFEGGKRLKIAWYNARTSHYMLVDQMGKRVDMMSGLQMAKEMIAGKAKIISGSSKPFFERALENIFQKLNEQAELAKAAEEKDFA